MEASKSIKTALDRIEQPIAKVLKAHGFEKKGRTYNRCVRDRLIQVINFQSGTFPIGNYEIPGIRESFYGRFVVNLGVAIPEIYQVTYPKFPIPSFWKEFECQIRVRLGKLLYRKDHWWEIADNGDGTSKEIINGLESKGLSWLSRFDSHEKICKHYTSSQAPRADLDVAIITFLKDHQKGEELFRAYYKQNHANKGHQQHVKEVAALLGIVLA